MDFKLFADRVKEARKNAGLSQAELAAKLGVGQNTVSNYENTTGSKGNAPKLETAAKIAEVLNVSLDWLVGINFKKTSPDTISGCLFLNHLTRILENPEYVATQYEADDGSIRDGVVQSVNLGYTYDSTTSKGCGFTLDVNGTKALELYDRLENLLTIRQKLKDGDVPSETIDDVIRSMREKIVNEYAYIFEEASAEIASSDDSPF